MFYNIEDRNGITFKIDFNKENILRCANDLISSFELDRYVRYGESPEWGDSYLKNDEYEVNVHEFAKEIETIDESKMRIILSQLPRKKNGKLKKNRIYEICSCKNTQCIHEWHNTWIYEQVIAKAKDEDTVEIFMRTYVDTPA